MFLFLKCLFQIIRKRGTPYVYKFLLLQSFLFVILGDRSHVLTEANLTNDNNEQLIELIRSRSLNWERLGTTGNAWEHFGAPRNGWERPGALESVWERLGTQGGAQNS